MQVCSAQPNSSHGIPSARETPTKRDQERQYLLFHMVVPLLMHSGGLGSIHMQFPGKSLTIVETIIM